jgi:uncharacterized protein
MAITENRLSQETSPYLLQHADNPVHWRPWDAEALTMARDHDRPILLSIGYSACHWCHVMAHESFENEDTARIMNELYVCIKVDREERPDLDKIYQTSYQILNQRGGGWPLTMFLTPDDHMPIFAGTYFPNEQRHGLPSFQQVLTRVAEFYQKHRAEITQQSDALRSAYQRLLQAAPESNAEVDADLPDQVIKSLAPQYDRQYGGFGDAPKFPHPTTLELCLRQWHGSQNNPEKDHSALHMALHTLRAMALGGINDQLGGGFCRYSVDAKWMIPHFEKMMYDNGQLLSLYADAFLISNDPLFKNTAIKTAEWVIDSMQSSEGGYFSSLDADTEHEEGKYYVWDKDEIRSLVSDDEYEVMAQRYKLDGPANFEGKWHLHAYAENKDIARTLDKDEDETGRLINNAHKKLYAERMSRIQPGRDDKILTSWNGLAIKGMARCGRLLQHKEFVASAEQALEFIKKHLYKNGRLLATYKDGKAHLNAYLDDYVFLIDGIMELLQARWNNDGLAFAVQLMDTVLQHYADTERGGFFFTANDHEQLIYRPKPAGDDAIPSGNAVAVRCLLQLGHVLGETRYLDAAEKTLQTFNGEMKSHPPAYCGLLCAADEYLQGTEVIIIRGTDKTRNKWQSLVEQQYQPNRVLLSINNNTDKLPAALEGKKPQGDIVAYICQAQTCSAAITDLATLEQELGFKTATTEMAG